MSFLPLALHQHWIPADTTLSDHRVTLRPLCHDDLETLCALGSDPRIWACFPSDRSDPAVHFRHLAQCFSDMQRGLQHAFCIQLRSTGQIVGMTRLFHLDAANRQLEIGSWLHPDHWRGGINTAAKFLLLEFCFERLATIRVQFRTDVRNLQSRQALEKMGAVQEGIFRNERIRADGSTRDAVFYSILDREWPDVRAGFLKKMQQYQPEAALFA
jgi:RimJ/RimL family protein N-acetyltransferase